MAWDKNTYTDRLVVLHHGRDYSAVCMDAQKSGCKAVRPSLRGWACVIRRTFGSSFTLIKVVISDKNKQFQSISQCARVYSEFSTNYEKINFQAGYMEDLAELTSVLTSGLTRTSKLPVYPESERRI